MEQNLFYSASTQVNNRWLIPAVLGSIFLGWLISFEGITMGVLLLMLPFCIAFVIVVFLKPKAGYILFIVYCFIVPGLSRHIDGPQFGLGQDGMLVLTWLGVVFHRGNKFRYRHLNNDLVWLSVVWFIVTVLEIIN